MFSVSPISNNQPNFKGVGDTAVVFEALGELQQAMGTVAPDQVILRKTATTLNEAGEDSKGPLKHILKGAAALVAVGVAAFSYKRILNFGSKVAHSAKDAVGALVANKKSGSKEPLGEVVKAAMGHYFGKGKVTSEGLSENLNRFVKRVFKSKSEDVSAFLQRHNMRKVEDILINTGALAGALGTGTALLKGEKKIEDVGAEDNQLSELTAVVYDLAEQLEAEKAKNAEGETTDYTEDYPEDFNSPGWKEEAA